MKRQLLLAAGICLVILVAVLAMGQQWTQQARVSVPFEFVFGTTVLPAGNYSVSTPAGGTTQIMFTNTRTGASAVANNIDISMKGMNNENSNLVFVLDASGRHVLHQVWIKDQSHGHDLLHEKGIPEPPQ
jgi:hypothetical protein